jgi:endonuclease-3 related protein
MVGSLLVQRTTWRNAALALAELRQSNLLRPAALATIDADALAPLIRRAGFFRVKAGRLRRLSAFVEAAGGIPDSILLYAFNRPVVVIDEYLRRLVRRLAATTDYMADDLLRDAIFAEVDDTPRLNEFHALVVEHGKRFCASRPRCDACSLKPRCGHGQNEKPS